MAGALPDSPPPVARGDRTLSFGDLKSNSEARDQRGRVIFFDSADWAMGHRGRPPQSQPPSPDVIAALTSIPQGDAPLVNDDSD
jgi:hypothetical protein